MKKKVLALVGCIATTAPTISSANVMPENLAGLSLGEVSSSSFLNQPFKGVIPFLFTNVENVKELKVNLAPEFIFNEIGAEKHPILSHLNFQIAQQNKKPVILISSNVPIQLPFLNFVLEIKGPEGSLYQDYTVLLDPASKEAVSATQNVDYVVFDQAEAESIDEFTLNAKKLLKQKGSLLLSSSLSLSKQKSSSKQKLKYRVKTGDSLSKIAQKHKTDDSSVNMLSLMIFQKNPKAFVRGDQNKIKKGALLNLPTVAEIEGFEIAQKNNVTIAKQIDKNLKDKSKTKTESQLSKSTTSANKYTVVKGDSLSKITKKFAAKEISFTKMMNAIFNENQEAFVNKSKNKLIAGAELSIPTFSNIASIEELKVADSKDNLEREFLADPDIMSMKMAERNSANEKSSKVDTIKPDQYLIKEGDTLSYIVKTIGHKEVPFAKMLKSIYANNPDSFIDGSMTKLVVGSVITLPPLGEFNISAAPVAKVSGLKKASMPSMPKKADVVVTPVTTNNKNVSSTDLVKRIRELRKELKQTKGKLSALKSRLSQKELLLQQKNIQLESLETSLTQFTKNDTPKLVPVSAVAVKQLIAETNPVSKAVQMPVPKDSYKPKSQQEMLKLKQDLIRNQEKTQKQIDKIKELKSKILSPTDIAENTVSQGLFKKYGVSEAISFTKTNYVYLSMALILSLLLIRYRRELYSYTYSSISYDQPSYYPIPDADKLILKEKNITHHDSQMDDDVGHYDFLTEDPAQPKIVINPVLVEAEKELFVGSEESKEIEHCEHLVTELFDDLLDDEDASDDTEWNDIEQVCDTYIEKIKDEDTAMTATENGVLVEEAADFNHMMSDLLESLDKVDKSVKRNNISDDAFPDLVASSHAALAKAKQANLSFPPPKS